MNPSSARFIIIFLFCVLLFSRLFATFWFRTCLPPSSFFSSIHFILSHSVDQFLLLSFFCSICCSVFPFSSFSSQTVSLNSALWDQNIIISSSVYSSTEGETESQQEVRSKIPSILFRSIQQQRFSITVAEFRTHRISSCRRLNHALVNSSGDSFLLSPLCPNAVYKIG